MLGEISELTLTSSWKDIKKLVKEDPRYSKFSSSDRVKSALLWWWEKPFVSYMCDSVSVIVSSLFAEMRA